MEVITAKRRPQDRTAGPIPDSVPHAILLVDDSNNDALVIRHALRDAGLAFTLTHVASLPALAAALGRAAWDIVLCDYAMPGLSIDEVLDLLADQAPEVPVVMVTGTVGEEAVADVMRHGVVDIVLKDRLLPRLPLAIAREVGRGRRLQAVEARQRRSQAVLSFFQDATPWRDAADGALAYLGDSFVADVVMMTAMQADEPTLTIVAVWSTPRFAAFAARLQRLQVPAEQTLTAAMSVAGEGLIVRQLADLPDGRDFPIVRDALASGLSGLVCQPLAAGERHFAVLLMFADARDDLPGVAAAVADISRELQPLLYRKVSEDERDLLRNALDATGSGVLITHARPLDAPGPRIVYANPATAKMTGWEVPALLGQSPRLFQGPDTDGATSAAIRRALAAAEPITVEMLNYRRDGTPFHVELDITPVHDHGHLTHFIAIQTETTARRAAEAERASREASFRLLFESNPVPMWVFCPETLRFLEVNAAAVACYGWSREEFLTLTLVDVRPPEDRDSFLATGLTPRQLHGTMVVRHMTRSGRHMTIHAAVHGIEYQGRDAYLVALWDVTEMEEAREALRRSNAELAALAETLSSRTADLVDAARLARMGTWTLNFAPRHLEWSPETFAILGQDPARFTLHPENIMSCIHPDDRMRFASQYQRLRTQDSKSELEYRIVRPSGEIRVLRELARPRLDSAGRVIGLSGVVQDITEHKTAETALRRAEKLKTIGQITGGIAHDFNNLLTVVGLNLETVLSFEDLSEDARSLLDPALHATRRSAELTGKLLSYARKDELNPSLTDLRALVAVFRPLLERAVGQRHRLVITLSGDDLRIVVDPGQFENALMNLVINARDALGDDGRIHVSLGVETIPVPYHGIPDVVPAGRHVRVQVADNGHGIPPDLLQRIFEPFFTTKPEGAGSGLGLSSVYGFVHQSQGCMTVASVPGEGTRIDLHFPMARQQAEQELLPAAVTAHRRVQGLRALVVEDSDLVRRTLERALTQLGFGVVAVGAADAALARLQSGERFDLLFSDVGLPGEMDGVQLAKAVEVLAPDVTVVLTSGDTSTVETGGRPWAVLPKPFKVSALIEVLEAGLRRPG
jgi:PAS domain S-box-containing protein